MIPSSFIIFYPFVFGITVYFINEVKLLSKLFLSDLILICQLLVFLEVLEILGFRVIE
jgi:hypothetical protein